MSKTENELKYDENVKKFLSQKIILAHILVSCVKEFKGMDAAEVVPFIEGEPEVSGAEVHPKGTVIEDFISPKITGMNTEDASDEEGTVYFDIKFCVYVPSIGETIKLIIDVEAQNNFSPGYDIVTRGVYYGARMISAQKGVEFTNSDYDSVKKVYSIWICVNPDNKVENTTVEYSMGQKNLVGVFPEDRRYDLLSVILVCLSEQLACETDEYRLHRLLEAFFSPVLSREEKRVIIETEYGIIYSGDIERSVNEMCNVSQGLIDRGRREGMREGRREGMREGMQLIMEAVNLIKDKKYTTPEELIAEGYDEMIAKTAIKLV